MVILHFPKIIFRRLFLHSLPWRHFLIFGGNGGKGRKDGRQIMKVEKTKEQLVIFDYAKGRHHDFEISCIATRQRTGVILY